jgi:hypothetical protein
MFEGSSAAWTARVISLTAICVALVWPFTGIFAAGKILTPNDSNSRVTVENAVVSGNDTIIFFLTWPDLGDPNSGKECGLNYYSVNLRAGLPTAAANVVARNVCTGLLQKSGLLNNGEALIVANDRLERWRAGEQVESQTFASIAATQKMSVTSANLGGQLFGISPGSGLVMAIPLGGFRASDFPGASMVLTSLNPSGELRWNAKLDLGQHYTSEQLWAAEDGGALMYLHVHSVTSMLSASRPQLRFVGAAGQQSLIDLVVMEEQFDFASVKPGAEEDLQRFYEHQRNAKPETIETLSARSRAGGGFDVLFHRKGGIEGREGLFLFRLGADGGLQSEIALGSHIVDHGLEDWHDFYVSGDKVVLLSRVMATQPGVRARRSKYMQNVVSWVDLESGLPDSRLIPLDQRYLEAAMNAGDAEIQYLEGLPGGEPVLLTAVGGKPVAVSVGWISQRQVLRINEADHDLRAFTEVFEANRDTLAKAASRNQRKIDPDARMERMQSPQAGVEGAEQGSAPNHVPATSQDMAAQIAAAMAEAQQQMADDPSVTPEMRAQLAAVMAQMGTALGGAPAGAQGMGTPPGGGPGLAASAAAATNPDNRESLPERALEVDSNQRALIEYENADDRLITLLIFNRQTGEELFRKDYPNGVIYEYVDFSQYGLPLEQIGVLYREVAGMILEDLTPMVQP